MLSHRPEQRNRFFLQRNLMLQLILMLQWFADISNAFALNFKMTSVKHSRPQVLLQSMVSPPSYGNEEVWEEKFQLLDETIKELHKREIEQKQPPSFLVEKYEMKIKMLEGKVETYKNTETNLFDQLEELNLRLVSERTRHEDEIDTLTEKFQIKNQKLEESVAALEERLSTIQEKHDQDMKEQEKSTSELIAKMKDRLEQYEEQLLERDSEIESLQRSLQSRYTAIGEEAEKARLQMQMDYEEKLLSKVHQIETLRELAEQTRKNVLTELVQLLEDDKK